MKNLPLFFCCLLLQLELFSQVSISGQVISKYSGEGLPATIRFQNSATMADTTGRFRLTFSSLPATLRVTAIGHKDEELVISDGSDLLIQLFPEVHDVEGIMVMSVSKTSQKLVTSPVSIVYLNRKELNYTPALSYWGAIEGKTGLVTTTSSMNFKTYSTRGFNGSGSSRVNQYMDGMDNQAPGLNFSIGNFIGLTELDIENIEILPGASSALYGSGGVNGTILVNSRSPFTSPGFSFMAKQGISGIDKSQRGKAGGYLDYVMRWAHKVNEKFAWKIGAEYMQAIDWLANDSTNYLRNGSAGNIIAGTRMSDPNYDGVNVYGDETKTDIRAFMNSSPQLRTIFARYLNTAQNVSRTGYHEAAMIDPKTWNLKLSAALHYKLTDKLEAILMGYFGTGNTVFTGNNRYALKGIKVGQYKLELKHDNWFVRSYTTQENAGQAYSSTITAQYINEGWKPSFDPSNMNGSWYPQYFNAFASRGAQIFQTVLMNGGSLGQAQDSVYAAAGILHSLGRNLADVGRPDPGSSQFKDLFNKVRAIPIPRGGLFLDQSQLWMSEGQYNFRNKIKIAEIIVGVNLKKYILNSEGTIFIDTAGPLRISEYGAYALGTKKLLNEKLTLTISGRYDKNQNFAGKITPRFTAVFTAAPNNYIRASYQTAYRFPTTQQQWIKVDVGNAILLGGLPWITNYLNVKSTPTYKLDPATGTTTPYVFSELKPESLRSFEIGYKSLIKKRLLVDAYVYKGTYSNFLGRIILVQPGYPKPFSIVTNHNEKIKTSGFGISLDHKLKKNYSANINFHSDRLSNVPKDFELGFNTPKYNLNAGISNTGFDKSQRLGFGINFRWQDEYYSESGGFANGMVDSYTTLDAQINYKFPKIKMLIKLGGTNITNNYYQSAFGNPYIGGLYYLSVAYNVL